MRKNSLAYRNIIILILSIFPFFVGIGISVYNSSDTEYFSAAINIAGSQRMRTMLISNYMQSYYDANSVNNNDEIQKYREILETEITKYQRYFHALQFGDDELGLKRNEFDEIIDELVFFTPKLERYISSINRVLIEPNSDEDVTYVAQHAMEIKDHFDTVTVLFKKINDKYIYRQRYIDMLMIAFGAVVTMIGLVLSIKIKHKEYHANYDYLTKLKNRHSLFEDTKDLVIYNCTLFFIDLNRFKMINDTYGHSTGDEILVGVSSRLKSVFGSQFLYRYGGDEFIAILEDSYEEKTRVRIEKRISHVRQVLSEPIMDSLHRKHYVGLSMGVVSSDVQIDDWEQLVNLSDDLMYDSKTVSGHVIVCNTKEELEERMKFSDQVDDVFSKGSLNLHYDPVYSLCDDSLKLYNVTSIWEEGQERLKAAEFLPILQRKGLLTELDKNTFKMLDLQYKSEGNLYYETDEDIKFIVTVAKDTLRNYKTNDIVNIIQSLEMPLEKIIIKVQEDLLNYPVILDALLELKNRGIILAIDNITIDVTIKESIKYQNINMIKIGNSLSRALLEKDFTKKIISEFIDMLVATDHIIIIEGVNIDELRQVLKHHCKSSLEDKILYTHKK